jgi:hypothetical protein
MERSPDQRTERDLVIFHDFVMENFPALLKRVGANTLAQLQEEIGELYETAEMTRAVDGPTRQTPV